MFTFLMLLLYIKELIILINSVKKNQNRLIRTEVMNFFIIFLVATSKNGKSAVFDKEKKQLFFSNCYEKWLSIQSEPRQQAKAIFFDNGTKWYF